MSKFHEAKHHVNVRLDMDEMDLTAAESKATYEEIKKYVAEHPRQPQCPKEKEDAIVKALKAFRMI